MAGAKFAGFLIDPLVLILATVRLFVCPSPRDLPGAFGDHPKHLSLEKLRACLDRRDPRDACGRPIRKERSDFPNRALGLLRQSHYYFLLNGQQKCRSYPGGVLP